jgi:hypothetical protein
MERSTRGHSRNGCEEWLLEPEAQIIVINLHLLNHVIAIIETAFAISRATEENRDHEIRVMQVLFKEVEDARPTREDALPREGRD